MPARAGPVQLAGTRLDTRADQVRLDLTGNAQIDQRAAPAVAVAELVADRASRVAVQVAVQVGSLLAALAGNPAASRAVADQLVRGNMLRLKEPSDNRN